MLPTQIKIQSLTVFGTWLWTTLTWHQQHYNHRLVLLLSSKLPVSAWSQLDSEEIMHIVLAVDNCVYFNRVQTVLLNTQIYGCKWNNKSSEIIPYSQLCLYCNIVTRKALNECMYHESGKSCPYTHTSNTDTWDRLCRTIADFLT